MSRIRRRFVIWCSFVVLALAAGFVVHGFLGDDAYITFRIARNFAETGHWTFNLGHATGDGATSPLWALVLAGAYRIGIPLVGFAEVVAGACGALSAIAVYEAARSQEYERAGLAAGVLLSGSTALAIDQGMELPLVLALAALSIWAAATARDGLLGILLVLVVAARPDMVLLAAAILAATAFYRRRIPMRTLLAGVGVAAGWAAFLAFVVGTALPDTLTAKVAQGRSGLWGHHSYVFSLLHPWRGSTTNAPLPIFNGTPGEFAYVVLWILAVVGLWRGLRNVALRPAAISALGFGAAYVVAYGVVFDVPNYVWYFAGPLFVLLLFAGLGLDTVLPPQPATLGVFVAALAITVAAAGPVQKEPQRYLGYLHAVKWIQGHVSRNATLACAEIGYLGWAQPQRRVVDYLGLLSPTAAAHVASGDMGWWIRFYKPDFWLVGKPVFKGDMVNLNASWFDSAFRQVWTDGNATLYQRIAVTASTF